MHGINNAENKAQITSLGRGSIAYFEQNHHFIPVTHTMIFKLTAYE